MALLGLVLATGLIYQQALSFDFVSLDDPTYIGKNHHVQRGLTAANVVWAFTSLSVSNWHPLTWLSHMLDIELYGLDPRGHHLSNVILHIANVLLLFALLRSLTGALWRSACVAMLFAIHPLHVESVAWIAERKDLLCAFFWFLALWSYGSRARRRPEERVGLSLVLPLTALALLAKPMAVTLPFTLLLLDYWPLGRLSLASLRDRVLEKAPLFALALACSLLTLLAQGGGGAMESAGDVGLDLRLANAVVAYATYLLKCVWPMGLAALYPHPYIAGTGGSPWELWQVAGSIALLLSLSGFVALARRDYLTMGWLWYLGTLVPVIGIVQVGTQAFADRYTYIPLIGVFIPLVWGAAALARRLGERAPRLAQPGAGMLGVAALVTLGALSWHQTSHWRGSVSLFEHALAVTPDNAIIHLGLASSLSSENRSDEALSHARRALELKPDYGEAHGEIARVYAQGGRYEQALVSSRRAVQLSPTSPDLHYNLALHLLRLSRLDAAMEHLQRAVELKSDWAPPRYSLAAIHRLQGRSEQAILHYLVAIELRPELAEMRLELASTLAELGRHDEAAQQYNAVLAREPQHARALEGLKRARAGRTVQGQVHSPSQEH